MTSERLAPSWRRRLRGYLALARVSNAPTVVSNAVAGAALGGAFAPGVSAGAEVALVATAVVLLYTGGMALNDLFDHAIDLRERPERPLPSGVVTRTEVGVTVALLFLLAALLLWFAGPEPFLSGLALIALIVLYDAWHKTNPLSPLLMAGTRALVYVTGYLAVAPRLSTSLLVWAGLLGLYIVGLTYLAKLEGRGVRRSWPVVPLLLPAVYTTLQGAAPIVWLGAASFAAWVIYSLSFLLGRKRRIGTGIARLIAGVSLLDALVLLLVGSPTGVAIALAAFGVTLLAQRYVKGT